MPASARRCFWPPDRAVGQRLVHARPDGVAGYGKVFGTEGDVVPDARQHHLRFRVLLHEPGPPALGSGHGAVNQQRTGLVGVPGLAVVVVDVSQHAGQRVQQRGLPGAGRSEEEHALTGSDVQVEGMDGGFGPAGVPPAPSAGPDGGGVDRVAGVLGGDHQEKTGSVAALRDAKELRTPVRARPRVASQHRAPARMAPETVVRTM